MRKFKIVFEVQDMDAGEPGNRPLVGPKSQCEFAIDGTQLKALAPPEEAERLRSVQWDAWVNEVARSAVYVVSQSIASSVREAAKDEMPSAGWI
jgi:hypothetical protein